MQHNSSEAAVKKDLVYAYKILSYLGLDDHTYTHLSARVESENFYIHPFGLRFEEVRVANLLKVSSAGEVLEGREEQYNKTGYNIHGSIYKARGSIDAIFHIHSPHIVAVSALKAGLMPVNQWALHFYEKVSYHNYDSLVLDQDQGVELIHSLGTNNVLMLRHHGVVVCGSTVPEAMFYAYHLDQACKAQCLLLSMNAPYHNIPHGIRAKTVKDVMAFEENLGARDWNAWVRLIDRHYMQPSDF